jgi:glycosyltransferase involved in cell wall biosynthesis
VRGNSLSWAFAERKTLQQPYDLMVATSMTDLSALKGMVPGLAAVPSLVYCHENQFAFPERRGPLQNDPKITNLYTLLSADRVIFNSVYNRESFIAGAQALLRQMPDAVPAGVVDSIVGKSCVLPVPLEQHWFENRVAIEDREQRFTIVWNHRWEYDKAPERLFAALLKLHQAGEDFRVHVVGQQFRKQPPVFAEMYPRLQQYIGEWGMVESEQDYRLLLQRSHVVLTTALHEFQGLAMLEAMACGCVPLAPDRLAYPEYIPDACRYASFPDDADAESAVIAYQLQSLCSQFRHGVLPEAPGVEDFSWKRLESAYRMEINGLA